MGTDNGLYSTVTLPMLAVSSGHEARGMHPWSKWRAQGQVTSELSIKGKHDAAHGLGMNSVWA